MEIRFALDLQKFKDKVNADAPDTKIVMTTDAKPGSGTTGKPIEQTSNEPRNSLIDREHLARQTLYDKALQNEVLVLFHQQLLSARAAIAGLDAVRRSDLAHNLIGAARGVGAFPLAEVLESFRLSPGDPDTVNRVIDVIESLLRELSGIEKAGPQNG